MKIEMNWGYAPNGWGLVPRWLLIVLLAFTLANLVATALGIQASRSLSVRLVQAEQRIAELEAAQTRSSVVPEIRPQR